MKCKILIDASTVTYLADGLSNYIIGLIQYLPVESFNDFEYTVLINPGLDRPELMSILNNGNFKIIEKRIKPIGLKRDWNMFWFLRKYKAQFDLIHITSNNYPLSLKNGICTIHDITFKKYFDHPKYSFNLATTYMDLVIRNCLKKSTAIIAVSNATKNELINCYNLQGERKNKISVIYEGFEHLENNEEPPSLCEEGLQYSGSYLFYLGSFRVHKNIENLLLAYKLAINHIPAGIKLIISGNDQYLKTAGFNIVAEINKFEKRVIFTGYLSNACVEKYFRNSDAFILPSLSEGFGIPVLEAFYYNKPVLCSNTTSLPEVAGNAAIYFNPSDPQSIADAIIQFYADPSMAISMVEKGNKQLKNFSWAKTALETTALYKKYLDVS